MTRLLWLFTGLIAVSALVAVSLLALPVAG